MSCPKYQYKSKIDNQCHVCEISGCAQCDTTGKCTSCINGKLKLDNNAVCQLKQEYLCVDSTNKIKVKDECQKCHDHCTQCYGTKMDQCLSCKTSITISDVKYFIIRNNTSCIKVNDDKKKLINSCGPGYILNSLGSCDVCPLGCAYCNIKDTKDSLVNFNYQCNTCFDDYKLKDGSCIIEKQANANQTSTDITSTKETSNPSTSTIPDLGKDLQYRIMRDMTIIIVTICIILFLFGFKAYRMLASSKRELNNQKKVADYRWNLLNYQQNEVPMKALNKPI